MNVSVRSVCKRLKEHSLLSCTQTAVFEYFTEFLMNFKTVQSYHPQRLPKMDRMYECVLL